MARENIDQERWFAENLQPPGRRRGGSGSDLQFGPGLCAGMERLAYFQDRSDHENGCRGNSENNLPGLHHSSGGDDVDRGLSRLRRGRIGPGLSAEAAWWFLGAIRPRHGRDFDEIQKKTE